MAPITTPTEDPPNDTASRFDIFHRTNPHVFGRIVEEARRMKGAGVNRFSMTAIFERLRWIYAIQTQGDEYRLNNNFRPYYARLVMDTCPDLGGFFECRRSAADDRGPK